MILGCCVEFDLFFWVALNDLAWWGRCWSRSMEVAVDIGLVLFRNIMLVLLRCRGGLEELLVALGRLLS